MIRIGIGGWVFEPWRGVFYPRGLPQARELSFAGENLTGIEVNGTYYGTQKPATFRKWAGDVPDGFMFSLKAPRFATNRRVLAEAGPSIEKFVESGISELGKKLGPILWQFMPTKKFDPEDFSAFLDLLPKEAGGHKLRHAVEVRHESFVTPDFTDMIRKRNVAVVYAHSDTYPEIADPTADFVYARLQETREDETTGYSAADLDAWAERVRTWEKGGAPADLPLLSEKPKEKARDCFVYFISGAKVRNPAAAKALIERLGA
jgi:uncharacterized protein YecE (DUF72 family)